MKLVVGPINKGYKNDVLPFNIDDDSFPTLVNAYQWRGRVKRKRGTSLLNRLLRELPEGSIGTSGVSPWNFNIFDVYTPTVTPEDNATLARGRLEITINSVPRQFYEDNSNGSFTFSLVGDITGATQADPCEITSVGHTLSTGDMIIIRNVGGMGELNGLTYTITVVDVDHFTLDGINSTTFDPYTMGGIWIHLVATNVGSINYLSGDITIVHTAGSGIATTAFFGYYPVLPVMGLEDFSVLNSQFVGTLAFDTRYAYNILVADPYDVYDVSYYKQPPVNPILYPMFVDKPIPSRLNWNGEDYQQFYSCNYQGAFWCTNGIKVPFDFENIGMQFKLISTVTVTTPTEVSINIVGHGLQTGDFVFINEVLTTTGINYQTGYVIAVTDANNFVVKFPFANIVGNGTGGIAQYLTTSADPTKDCIRWYDGDPTNGVPSDIEIFPGKGWVNFMPPLSNFDYSIADLPPAQYYLVGGRILQPFKDRLLVMGPVVQTSSGLPVYLQDTVIYSQNGSPFYTYSFTGDVISSATNFVPMLLPTNQTGNAASWFEDVPGFGGFQTAGLDQPIITASLNQDVILIGFQTTQTRFVFNGNDLRPFDFYFIDSEQGSTSTFSSVNLGEGVLTKGSRGFVYTTQVNATRFDLDIPDEVFQVNLTNNGSERFTAQRDFINEWVYFSYLSGSEDVTTNIFNSQTLQYNYRDKSWALFYENYTTYGLFRCVTGFIWSTVGRTFPTWSVWNEPWNAGSSSLLKPKVIGGNQQGFVIFRDEGTSEAFSLAIESFTGSRVVSPDHCLNVGDFVKIDSCLGTISSQVNNKIFSVESVTNESFLLNPQIESAGLTYIGGGLIQKIYVPFVQTKQFPIGWADARKTRLGVQRYLLSKTERSQIELQIYLSQDSDNNYNYGPVVPSAGSTNNSLIYSTVLYTCPESTNLGLTPQNSNLQMPTAINQNQIWHRINTSLLGDTVQLGFTMSDAQVRALYPVKEPGVITGVTLGYPTVLLSTARYELNQLVIPSNIQGTMELNGNTYNVLSSTPTSVTLDVDSTLFTPYVSGGIMTPVAYYNHDAEIELHGFIIDVTQSSMLA